MKILILAAAILGLSNFSLAVGVDSTGSQPVPYNGTPSTINNDPTLIDQPATSGAIKTERTDRYARTQQAKTSRTPHSTNHSEDSKPVYSEPGSQN